MIKVIAFDYADVIAPGPMSKFVRENLKKEDEKYIFYKNQAYRWDNGELTINEVYDVLAYMSGVPAHLIWDKFYAKLKPDKKVIEIINQLKKNYKIFLFSNFHGEMLRNLLKNQSIINLFEEIIISSEHKALKPNPDFFKILINKSRVNPHEVLFIDDREENIIGAKKIGINTIHFENADKLKTSLSNFGITFTS